MVEVIPSLIAPLIALAYLKTGDMHMANIMYDLQKKKAYIIDYDEVRSSELNGELFYFNKEPAEKKKKLWLSIIRPHYKEILQELRKYKFEKEYLDKVHQYLSVEPTSAPSSIPVEVSDVQQKEKNIGEMRRGAFSGITYSGFKLDEMKSGLQKYIRRGMVEKAMMCATELYRMIEVEAKGTQSNLYNRLAVISCEDIGPANMDLVLSVVNLVNEENRNFKRMIRAVELLCESSKTRIMSHLWFAYTSEEGRKMLRERLGFEGLDTDSGESPLDLPSTYPSDLSRILQMMAVRLNEKNDIATYWEGKFMEYTGKVKKRGRMTNHYFTIENVFNKFLPAHEVSVFLLAFLKQSEKRPFLMTPIVAILFNDVGKVTEIPETKRDVGYLLEGKYKLELDDYVIDMHTKAGKKKNKGRTVFRNEGSMVTNQSKKHLDEDLLKMYQDV